METIKEFGPMVTFQKQNSVYNIVNAMGLKEKRHIFQLMREENITTPHALLPEFGITTGQFAIYNILTDKPTRRGISIG